MATTHLSPLALFQGYYKISREIGKDLRTLPDTIKSFFDLRMQSEFSAQGQVADMLQFPHDLVDRALSNGSSGIYVKGDH
jgi:hypothetical protein